ncbi:MAG: response regulator [Blastocatellia bacterium]
MNNKKYNILLVEDDEIDVMNVKRAFKKNSLPHTLHVTENGLEALSFLSSTSTIPQIILLDLNMPKMGGLEFLREIRQNENLKKLSVFILTTSTNDRDKATAYELNIAGYIVKPLELENFVQTIKTLESYWSLCEWL